jgi:hypothetical protein
MRKQTNLECETFWPILFLKREGRKEGRKEGKLRGSLRLKDSKETK